MIDKCIKYELPVEEFDEQKAYDVINLRYQDFKERYNFTEIVFVCIGTPKITGDAFGPLVGSLVKDFGTKVHIYGNTYNPIMALNVYTRMDTIYKKHPRAFIIGIDACIDSDANMIKIAYDSFKPGTGVNKQLGEYGDVTIVLSVGKPNNSMSNTDFLGRVELSTVYSAAVKVAKLINRFGDD